LKSIPKHRKIEIKSKRKRGRETEREKNGVKIEVRE